MLGWKVRDPDSIPGEHNLVYLGPRLEFLAQRADHCTMDTAQRAPSDRAELTQFSVLIYF